MALTDKIAAIADAIRAKTGKDGRITIAQMSDEIEGISSGAIKPYIEEEYDSSGNLVGATLHGPKVRNYAF